ncbi:MAG: Na-K-Cl cotransporter [Melioribacteraceae bacterium]|nr:MAG: Na-K-Cl cotransporter [Melioribacteraceae bacterium]
MLHKLTNTLKSLFSGEPGIKKFGTFGGVFTPDVLTILGVIMYLRLGWVVGNAGLLGAIGIIILAKLITIATGLSMSSITTNIKIGAGGAYSIISKSLGLEAGGSIGIPFYFAQTFSAALYIIGFTEGWIRIFPTHDPVTISVVIWVMLMLISYISTAFAIKIQYVILAVIGISILSFLFSDTEPVPKVELIGKFEDADFWRVFAIFFPAVTGIMAGANLSGDLKEPRKSIPLGTLSAIGVTMLVYISLAVFIAYFIAPSELRSNQMVMVDYALIEEIVLLGILAATFSSALGSIIGAPRILQALAENKSIPGHKFFAVKTASNEPRNAVVFTGGVILTALIMGNLDALASLITLFFLITYGMLNLVVFLQQSMKIISFRPTFKVPRFVSFTGALGCIFVMLLIDPVFSVIALVLIISIYVWLTRKGLKAEWGDIRGGMFVVLAEYASRIAQKFPRHQVAWKPDILLPIEDPKLWHGSLLFIKNLVNPSGSIYAFTVRDTDVDNTLNDLEELLLPLKKQKIMINSTVIEESNFVHGSKMVIQTLRGGALRPNTLFLTLGSSDKSDEQMRELIGNCVRFELGIIILRQHPRMAFGMQKTINLWLRDKSPNWHLAVLLALQLQLNWEGKINLVTVCDTEDDRSNMQEFLQRLSDQTRLPSMTEFHVICGNFFDAVKSAPRADVNIFGMAEEPDFDFARKIGEISLSSCLFVKDSGKESAIV